jgi:hypothetical protein
MYCISSDGKRRYSTELLTPPPEDGVLPTQHEFYMVPIRGGLAGISRLRIEADVWLFQQCREVRRAPPFGGQLRWVGSDAVPAATDPGSIVITVRSVA